MSSKPGMFFVDKSSTSDLMLANVVSKPTHCLPGTAFIQVKDAHGHHYYFRVCGDNRGDGKSLGFSSHQREYANLVLSKEYHVEPLDKHQMESIGYIYNMNVMLIGLASRAVSSSSDYIHLEEAALKDPFINSFYTDVLEKWEEQASPQQGLIDPKHQVNIFTVGQLFSFRHDGFIYKCRVESIHTIRQNDLLSLLSFSSQDPTSRSFSVQESKHGFIIGNSHISFKVGENQKILLEPTPYAHCYERYAFAPPKEAKREIFKPNWKLDDLGIGGLSAEFNTIFRRAFLSRTFPPSFARKLGIQHVKGILLYGAPGTGKTLMARQIGKMLNAKEPKIVNGPEILNKYVGASEENIRNLFKEAEEEQKKSGDYSGLHIIIFDEIDAICKQRGSRGDSTGVNDTIVNQLLSKMDGVDQLNNILVIGMTNRKDLIDEALLRPGRMEVQLEVGLPDKKARLEILNIHTAPMRKSDILDKHVNLDELVDQTKNFSGAELAGLVKSATSFAYHRHVNVDNVTELKEETLKSIKVAQGDFVDALSEVKPAFGVSEADLVDSVPNGIIRWDRNIEHILKNGMLNVHQIKNSEKTKLMSLLLYGPVSSGKTALAAHLAIKSEYPFIKKIAPENFVGFSESAKVSAISKIFDDASKSPLSLIIIDNIERLIEYVPIGPRFSNNLLQTLLVLIGKVPKADKRLLIMATTSMKVEMDELGFSQLFDKEMVLTNITEAQQLYTVLRELSTFESPQINEILAAVAKNATPINVGVKKLIMLAEMARQESGDNVIKSFLEGLQEESYKTQR